MKKFEYKKIFTATEEQLNQLGQEGWELVVANDYYIFKREIA